LSILFFEISADFDVTWGEDQRKTLDPVAAFNGFLKPELDKKENWTAALPKASTLHVSLRKLNETEGLVLHPLGLLKFSQRAIPLGIKLDKVGAPDVNDYRKLQFVTDDTSPWKVVSDPRENFAIAQFQKLSDAEKLSRPSFQMEKSGAELSVAGEQTRTSFMTKRTVRYETIIIDTNYKRFVFKLFRIVGGLFEQLLRGNAVALSPLSAQTKKMADPWDDPVVANQEMFAVVNSANNKMATTEFFESEVAARDFMRAEVAMNPHLADAWDVVPQFEVNMN
jgi:hypothetical protein